MEKQQPTHKVATTETDDVLTVYEVSYLLLPSIAMEQVQPKTLVLKEILTSLGALIISDESPILIDLAYPMTKVVGAVRHKVTTGYFGWIKFEINKEASVKKALDADQEVLRYLLIKTVRENTLLSGKMKLGYGDRIKKEEEAIPDVLEPTKESIPEEIDKSIDELVIV